MHFGVTTLSCHKEPAEGDLADNKNASWAHSFGGFPGMASWWEENVSHVAWGHLKVPQKKLKDVSVDDSTTLQVSKILRNADVR